jgi:hypothetical protein
MLRGCGVRFEVGLVRQEAILIGIRQGFDWKGAASMKPCIKHVNVLRKEALLQPCGITARGSDLMSQCAPPGSLGLESNAKGSKLRQRVGVAFRDASRL